MYSTALSGITSAQKWLDNTANNIANMNTPKFQKDKTIMSEQENGVSAQTVKSNDRNTYENEIVAQKQAAIMYTANAKMIKVQNDKNSFLNEIA